MSQYDIDFAQHALDLSNKTVCIERTEFVNLLQSVVFKTDAIKLGILCFFLGMGFILLLEWIDKRWEKRGSS